MQDSSLSSHHRNAGASMVDVDGVSVPRDFGDLAAEWRVARAGCAVADLSWRTHLEVTGKHRGRFVHNMTTCEIKGLEPGQGNFGMAVDGKGKLVASFFVEVGEDRFLLELARARRAPFVEQMKRYIVADRVAFEPRDGLTVLALLGPKAADVVEALLGEAPAVDADFHWRQVTVAGEEVRLRRNPLRAGLPGWDVTVREEGAVAVWSALAEAGATPVGHETFEALRIAAGVPRDGLDMTEANVPLESRVLYDTVDWDKGCYIGQEVIAMMHYRGRPNRHLVALRLPAADALPAPGDPVTTPDGKKAGVVGTSSSHPSLPGPLALAVVKRKYAEAGTALSLGEADVEILDVPLPAVE